jgi:hypothetical protein
MIKEFEKLSGWEQELLLKAPVVVSILAASTTGEINEWEKVDAIKLAHLKTFTAQPLLIPYYKEVDKFFKLNFEAMAKKYAPFNDANRVLLQKTVDEINKVISKLSEEFATTLRASLLGYAEHVKKAYKGFIMNFIFPFPLPGLTE